MDHFMLTDLDDKLAQQAELRNKLAGSLALQSFMPDIFEHGTCKVGGRATVHAPHEGTVTFTLGNGDVREMPAMKVPFRLWPKGMQADFEAMPGHRKQAIFKRIAA